MSMVHVDIDRIWSDRLGETWPPAAAVKLFGGMENFISAGFALVNAGFFVEILLTSKWSLGTFFS